MILQPTHFPTSRSGMHIQELRLLITDRGQLCLLDPVVSFLVLMSMSATVFGIPASQTLSSATGVHAAEFFVAALPGGMTGSTTGDVG